MIVIKITRTHGYLEVTHLFIHCFIHDSAKNMSHQYSSKESLPGQCEAIMIIYDDIYLVSSAAGTWGARWATVPPPHVWQIS